MVMFKGKEIDRDSILKEFDLFDSAYKDFNDYENWLEDAKYKYVVKYNGKAYPPKYILSKVSGLSISEFSGGNETNNLFKGLGFEIEKKDGIEDRAYWLYAPGEGGKYWKEFNSAGIMAIGWDYLGDLSKYRTKDDVTRALRQHDGEPEASKKNNATSCFSFAHEVKEGDLIFAKIGRRKIIGAGVVQSVYFFDNVRSYFKHVRRVDWFIQGNWDVPEERSFAIKTLTNITEYQDFVNFLKKMVGFESSQVSNSGDIIKKLLEKKHQVIFYGPPGTGKTFTTKSIAVNLITE